ncbi:uncharacterized protein PG986_014552 [Apiospora aurea]|uniref:Uncharacterized protein n=1 Tax=Apiospora aurea TaxID=335848 RepID=A0ABR1PTA5_9PEZI
MRRLLLQKWDTPVTSEVPAEVPGGAGALDEARLARPVSGHSDSNRTPLGTESWQRCADVSHPPHPASTGRQNPPCTGQLDPWQGPLIRMLILRQQAGGAPSVSESLNGLILSWSLFSSHAAAGVDGQRALLPTQHPASVHRHELICRTTRH